MNVRREDKDMKPRRVLVSLKTLAQMLDTTRTSARRWLKDAGTASTRNCNAD